MNLAQRLVLLLAAALLAACAMPQQAASDKVYEEPVVVTGSHVPRKATPGVQSVDGDAIRAQGQIAPSRGATGSKGPQ